MNRFWHQQGFSCTAFDTGTLKWLYLLARVSLALSLLSCNTNKINQSPAEKQELQWREIKSQYPVNIPALRGLLQTATITNNWKLMWQLELELCQIETRSDLKRAACKNAKQLASIFYQDESLQFDTSLTLFEQFRQHQDLVDASGFASNEIQQIDVLLAQNIVPTKSLQQLIENGSLQEARLLYLIGKNNENIDFLLKASQLFWQHNQIYKQADSLFLLATLQWAQGHNKLARSNAVKSLILHSKSGNTLAIKRLQRWLDEH